jgi:hypothetical protein
MVVRGRRAWHAGWTVVVALMSIWLTAGVARASQPLGALTQLPGLAGCFTYNGNSEDGAGTCSPARGIAQGESATVSPDGANVYVGSYPNSGASLGPGFAVFSRNSSTGGLTQLVGTAGCLTPNGSSSAGPGTCTKARGLIEDPGDGHDIAFTSGGRWAYLVAQNNPPHGTILIFQRDPSSGALTQLAGTAGCISSDGSSQDGAGTCQSDHTLNGPSGISISSDDRFLYVVDYFGPTRIHVFVRNASTGALSEVQCISEAPAPVGCSTGRVLGNSQFLALSPDGMHAYGGEFQHGLSIFDRDPASGLLTQKAGSAGCITDDGKDDTGASTCTVGRVVGGSYPILIAPNGATLYDPANADRGFSVFHINADGTLTQLSGTAGCVTINGMDNTGASTCATGRAVDTPYGGVISPDGSTLYVSQRVSAVGGVAVFSLNPTSGVATQLPGLQGCITADGSSNGTPGQCTDGTALARGYGMAVSPDGSSVYQATESSTNAGLAVYARETAPVCQATSTTTASGEPVTVSLRCSDADGDPLTRSIVSGPVHGALSAVNNATGTVTYTPGARFSGTDSFTFVATDGINAGVPTNATITVGPAPTLPTPALSKLSVSPSRFSLLGRKVGERCVKPTRKNRAHKRCRLPIKLRVSYTLNVAASVTFALKLQAAGRDIRGHCVKPTKTNRKHKTCTRFLPVRGKITLAGAAGADHFTFNGKIGGQSLGPGTYQLIATPTGGKSMNVTFKIVR